MTWEYDVLIGVAAYMGAFALILRFCKREEQQRRMERITFQQMKGFSKHV